MAGPGAERAVMTRRESVLWNMVKVLLILSALLVVFLLSCAGCAPSIAPRVQSIRDMFSALPPPESLNLKQCKERIILDDVAIGEATRDRKATQKQEIKLELARIRHILWWIKVGLVILSIVGIGFLVLRKGLAWSYALWGIKLTVWRIAGLCGTLIALIQVVDWTLAHWSWVMGGIFGLAVAVILWDIFANRGKIITAFRKKLRTVLFGIEVADIPPEAKKEVKGVIKTNAELTGIEDDLHSDVVALTAPLEHTP